MSVRFAPVPALDAHAQAAARARQDRLTKPTGALGRLEELSIWLAGVQGACPPRFPARPRVVIFAGDHGVTSAGVSAYPSEVTAQMVANFLGGGAAVNVLAGRAGAGVRVVDMAVASEVPGPVPPDLARWKVRASSGRIDVEDALTWEQACQAVDAGMQIADAEVDAGADLLIPGDMGIGNTTPAAVLIGALTGHDANVVTGRGTGVDDDGLARKRAVVSAALSRLRDLPAAGVPGAGNPVALLAAVGGADIAAMAGFLAQAAIRKTPVLLDGVVSGAAALVAAQLAPGAQAWWQAGHRSVEPAHGYAMAKLGLHPLLDLHMRLGEGSGALVALPIVAAAVEILSDMATFDEAHVSDRT